ncbi:hypothetical protein [Alsobacter sp. R-9]
MQIPATPLNRDFVATLNRRIARAGHAEAARAFLVRAAGWGVLLAGAGCALGALTVALAMARAPHAGAAAIAEVLGRALAETPLKVTGTVRLGGTPVVALAPDTTVGLAPDASVTVTGKVEADPIPRPAPEVLAGPAGDATVVTNFTIFKSVPYQGGSVVTGWRFASSEERRPSAQYCYFTQDLGDTDTAVRFSLAYDGVPNPKAVARKGFDPAHARQSCIWFQGGRP